MATNISSMLQFWKNFDLPELQRELDVNATDLAGRQDASDASRRKLVEKSKEFKKATSEEVRKSVAPLLRSFQSEIDALSKRAKASEADFLNLYKKLVELPDPVIALEQAEHYYRKAQKLNDIETENHKLRETLAEYNKEFAEVKNQEVTIKNLREKVRDYEKGTEERAKRLTVEKNEELQKQFAEKEKKLQETQLLIATKLGEAEQVASTYKAALESSQSELFDLKSKFDEEIAAKQAELDIVLSDLDRMTQKIATSDKELEKLREDISSQSSQTQEQKTQSIAMEEAFEVLSRSSLEAELANKEKEISQLVEDVQHLQGSMGKLRESSASAIAKLEEELAEKNSTCQDLQRQIEEREDYDEIKRELQIIKSTEFSSLDSASSDQHTSHSGPSKGKSLEMLLLEKNRLQQSENTALRAANAQLTGHTDPSPTTSPLGSPRYSSEKTPYRKEHRRLSSVSHHSSNLFGAHRDFSPIVDPTDALSLLQMQNQKQLNTLLNLKILAAVAAQNISSSPLLAGYVNLQSQLPKPFHATTAMYDAMTSERPPLSNSSSVSRSRVPSSDSLTLAKYLSQLQKLGSVNLPKYPIMPFQATHDVSDDSESEEPLLLTKNLPSKRFWGSTSTPRHVSDPITSNPSKERFESTFSRFQSRSFPAEKSALAEEVDTEELTRQVKELLQHNNIGQRAFGQYVLGLSQGSVSEILSKPKPWSKLTFKGKEPFYKMMDFLSSSRNLDNLKSLQRRDREEKVLCGSRTQPMRNADPESDQAIVNILAAAREEMRAEQEKLQRAQEIYALQRENINTRKTSSSQQETISAEISQHQEAALSDSSPGDEMATVASSRCNFSETSNIASRIEKINSSPTTNGASETNMLDSSLPSLIKRQRTATGNESGRVLKQGGSHKGKQSLSSDCQSDGLQVNKKASVNDTRGKNSEANLLDSQRDAEDSRTAVAEKESFDQQRSSESDNSTFVKIEFGESDSYFPDSELEKGPKIPFSATKEDLISASQRLIISHEESESLRRLFVTSTNNDPFIPPPLSPTAEDSRHSVRSSCVSSPGGGNENSFESPFIGDESVTSSHYINENSENSARNSPQVKSDPVLFKELSCARFPSTEQENVSDLSVGLTTASSSFSSMLSSGMSSLHTATSLFDSHASFTELSPVTTGSLFTGQRDPQEHDLSMSTSLSAVEGGQNGISSMLTPIAMGSHHHTTSPAPTYSALTNTITSSKYSSLQNEHCDVSFPEDQFIETSTITTPIPPEALRKLSASNIDTAGLSKQIRDRLTRHGICQRVFGEKILGLTQGTVSDILSHPKPWNKLTHKGREPFARMILWLADNTAGGLLPHHEGSQHSNPESNEHGTRSASGSPNNLPVNLTKEQTKSHSPALNSSSHFVALSSPSTNLSPSPHGLKLNQDRLSPVSGHHSLNDPSDTSFTQLERRFRSDSHTMSQEPSSNGPPITPLQQMLNIQEVAASCPILDTFTLTRKVKDLLTEHNIGQRIFGQAVLGLTQGSVSDLLSRPKEWRSLSLKGREPFVRMRLWLSDPNNVEQLKSLKMERWMEKKWIGKRQQRGEGSLASLSPVKKQRIVLSSEEKEVLRRAYGIEPYPSQETVDLLAIKLGRKSSTIVNWFHNYRSRVKRGFFPGEEIQEAQSKKHGSSKMSVKQLLDGITLSNPPSNHSSINNQSRRALNPQRAFSTKNGHGDSSMATSTRRNSGRVSNEVSGQSWPSQHVASPTNFERYAAIDHHMKTESIDQHFHNLQRSNSDDIYTNSVMHVKEEAKMLQLHGDTMFSPSFSYPMTNPIPELTLGDPVAMAAATSFIQPKTTHHESSLGHYSGSSAPLYTNLDDTRQAHHHHHSQEVSYAPTMASETPFSNTKLPVSPPSPQNNSILPPVHTLTPKKSYGSSPSNPNMLLPAASSLLNPPHSSPNVTQDMQIDPHIVYPHSHHPTTMHHLVSLSRPRYDTVLAGNDNMNNNSQSTMVSNVSLPDGVSLSVASNERSPVQSDADAEMPTTVWAPSSDETTHGRHSATNTSPITSTSPSTLNDLNSPRFSKVDDAITSGKESDDSYAWVF